MNEEIFCSLLSDGLKDRVLCRTRLNELNLSPPPISPCGAGQTVQKTGKIMYRELAKHPQIAQIFDQIQIQKQKPNHYMLFFETSEFADNFPWETLFHADKDVGFLALGRHPIGRHVPVIGPWDAVEFLRPVKMLAILSSTAASMGSQRASAVGEWEALLGALSEANKLLTEAWSTIEPPIKVNILTNEDDVMTRARAAMADLPWIVSCEWITSVEGIAAVRKTIRPHFIHVFCHGRPGEQPRLILGTRADCSQDAIGSLELSPDQLAEDNKSTWLVTLNACGAPSSGTGVQNFANLLVKKRIPAAIGMRDPIDTSNSAAIAGRFYADAFNLLSEIRADGRFYIIDWGLALSSVRMVLSCQTRDSSAEHDSCWHWSIPIFYTGSGRFSLRLGGQRNERRIELIEEIEELQRQERALAQVPNSRAFNKDAIIAKLQLEIREKQRYLRETSDE